MLKLLLPQSCQDSTRQWESESLRRPRTIHDVKYDREGRDVLHQRDGSDFSVRASESSALLSSAAELCNGHGHSMHTGNGQAGNRILAVNTVEPMDRLSS